MYRLLKSANCKILLSLFLMAFLLSCLNSNNSSPEPVDNSCEEVLKNGLPVAVNFQDNLWIPPVGFNQTGQTGTSDECEMDVQNFEVYPVNCLSSIQVFTESAYTAEIRITNFMGKLVHTSTQQFGHCGELQNPYRLSAAGVISYLVWDMRDSQGNYVADGKYDWDVTFKPEDGNELRRTYTQHICGMGEDRSHCSSLVNSIF